MRKCDTTTLFGRIKAVIEFANKGMWKSSSVLLEQIETEIKQLQAEKFCSDCGCKMSLWCEKDIKERMNTKNKELQAEKRKLKERNKDLVTENKLLRLSINDHQRAIDEILKGNPNDR